jgi:ribosomal protein S18 acetylase RimI-like enzyme
VIIRAVETHEIAALSALASRTYGEAFGASMSAEDLAAQLKATRSEEYFHRVLQTDTILVAVLDGAIFGYVQLSEVRIPIEGVTGADQELAALYVVSEHQGQGIGKALLEAALAHERFRRAPRIYLDVWEQNTRAIALYRKCGFCPAGRRDFVVDGRVLGSDLVMVRART